MNWCKLGFHKYEDVKTQMTKSICFGCANLPGWRVVQKCKHCPKISYMKLNISMPNKYLYQEEIWRDNG